MERKLLFIALFFMSMGMYAQSWTEQNTNFPGTAIGVDDIALVDSNIVWIKGYNGSGTGPKMRAFSKTADGGTTWTTGLFNGFGTNVMPYVLGASSATKCFAVAMDTVSNAASFWGTSDGGSTWAAVPSLFTGASSFADGVKFWNASKGFSYGDPLAGTYEIYTTADGGTTWTAATTSVAPVPASEYGLNGPDCATTAPGGVGFIMTNYGRILRTTDYGATWAITPTAPFASAAYGGVKIVASSANYIICATITTATGAAYIWKYTTDGGTTWQAYSPVGAFYDYFICNAPGAANTFVSSSPNATAGAGVSHSEDGGLTWVDYSDALLQPTGTNIQCLAINFYSDQIGWVGMFGTGQNSILKYRYVSPNGVNMYQMVNGNDVNIYPNPAQNVVNIEVNGGNKENINVSILDVTGKVIYNQSLNVNGMAKTSFDFSRYAKGVYVVNVNSGNDNYNKKLVIY